MKNMNQPSTTTQRIDSADALRGLAVMCIFLLHNVEHFIFASFPTDSPQWLTTMDSVVQNLAFNLFGGKAYAIFALLFGFTFSIQFQNQKKKGKDFGPRFLWRLLLLAGFATLNAAFFPGGDVLMLYAVMGISLFFVRKWSNKAILILAIIFFLQPYEWILFAMSTFDANYTLPDYGVGEMYAALSETTKNGSFLQFLWQNITQGQLASLLWALGAGRVEQTVGLFLVGLYVGRKGLLIESEQSTRFWTRLLILCAISFSPLYCLKEMTSDYSTATQSTLGTALDMWQKLAFTFILVSSFILTYRNKLVQKHTASLRLYGRMSLTNYVSQSLLGMLFYMPFGLYLAPHVGVTLSVVAGILMFLCQLQFTKFWMRHHKQGPLESLWHKATWI